ncbi:hypothetical protein F0562_020884 [Nyssa sinensis]|uniref:Glycosyltransferase n=1 Tax=Nyssa sinensis TaxID=561372 RepID=A0A5J5BRQ9_9ASTE|nr:hypothetical protein F0562_020884 [Nyssa sinensis]
MAAKQCHIMMFPWLAFGHMLPFLEFSKKLAGKGIRVSFVSTPKNIQRLPSIPPHLVHQIELVEIPLPSVEGLPENCEATVDVQLEQIQYLKKACDELHAPFEKLLHTDKPDLILAYTAATLGYLGPPAELKSCSRRTRHEHFAVPPDWFTFPSLVAATAILCTNSSSEICTVLTDLACQVDKGWLEFWKAVNLLQCEAVKSLKGEYLNLLEELYQRPVLPIGLLPPNLVENKTLNTVHSQWSTTFKWLDKQKLKSVVFVGFGSEYKMPIEEVHEMAIGLELSNLPFIWILRKPEGIDSLALLPPGFLTRISDRAMVNLGWAPQLEILAHPAIGGCLFHSGWGSIIESLGFGHPLILMPMVADQGLNAKLLMEKGMGYEVPRNEDGSFSRDMVSKSIRLVMGEQEGEPFRLKAAQMQTVFANHELHDNYINKFIQYLGNFKKAESDVHGRD